MENKQIGGYIVPQVWAKNGERIAKEEIKSRILFGLPLGNWPEYLKRFSELI